MYTVYIRNESCWCGYIYAELNHLKAVGVVRHLFYTSKIQLIVLELNHLIYKHV